MNVSSHKLSSEFHWQNLVQASCHLLNSSWPPASLLLNSCPWPLSAPTSSTERQTPASSPARPATPHTDISTVSGLSTGNPEHSSESGLLQNVYLTPVKFAMRLTMKSFRATPPSTTSLSNL